MPPFGRLSCLAGWEDTTRQNQDTLQGSHLPADRQPLREGCCWEEKTSMVLILLICYAVNGWALMGSIDECKICRRRETLGLSEHALPTHPHTEHTLCTRTFMVNYKQFGAT